MFAARGGHHLCVKMLIEKGKEQQIGPNVNQQDNCGETALMHAARCNGHKMSFCDGNVDSARCMSLLLREGADVNTQNCAGQTALMLTAQNGQSKGTQLLLGGANVNEQDKYGNTALMFAVGGGHVQCTQFLIQAGAGVNMKNYQSETALISALNNGYMECLDLLMKSGADVNYADGFGFTALKITVRNGHGPCTDVLINAGADVNNSDGGVTALMLAAGSNQPDIITQLMKAGADVNFKSSGGGTALSYALKANSTDCMKMLIGAGADSWGQALICKIMEENCQLKGKEIKDLLHVGASVSAGPRNALATCLKCQDEDQKELALLLFAAGEELKADEIEDVPDYLKPSEKMSLMHLCRESIREHLLQMSKVNLLVRVPKLGLPSQLVEYLLYGVKAESTKGF